jgi:hypothetical protein
MLLEEDYLWLMERVGPTKIGVVTRNVLHNYIAKKRDEERKTIDGSHSSLEADPAGTNNT